MKPAKKTAIDTTKLWENYFDAFKKHDWQKALSALNAVMEAEPSDPNVCLKIGDLEQRAGRAAEAISAYHKAAWHLIKTGFHQKALAIYKLILRIDPNNEEALKRSGELLMQIESEKEGPSGPEYAPSAPAAEPERKPSYEQSFGLPEMPSEIAEKPSDEEVSVTFPSFEEQKQPEMETRVMPDVFSSLPREEALKIIQRGRMKIYETGSAIVEEGDTGDSMFIIKSGRAKVIAHILGKAIELATLSEGDVFGEVAFLTGRPRTASVMAEGPIEVIEIDRLALEEAIEKTPRILEKLQDFYHSRVQDTIKKVKSNK